MKKTILTYGLISGIIVAAILTITSVLWKNNPNFQPSAVIGFASMILAFIFIFVGIKSFRDKENGGIISFGKAFKIGALIAVVASTFYVITWLISLHFYFPEFIERYSDCILKQAQESGQSAAEIHSQMKDVAWMKNAYKNPIYVILLTYMEILPLGLIIAVISALILKKKFNK